MLDKLRIERIEKLANEVCAVENPCLENLDDEELDLFYMLVLVKELLGKNRNLEKEADWLANKASINCPSPELEEKCAHKPLGKNECVECWREAARKEVQDVQK